MQLIVDPNKYSKEKVMHILNRSETESVAGCGGVLSDMLTVVGIVVAIAWEAGASLATQDDANGVTCKGTPGGK